MEFDFIYCKRIKHLRTYDNFINLSTPTFSNPSHLRLPNSIAPFISWNSYSVTFNGLNIIIRIFVSCYNLIQIQNVNLEIYIKKNIVAKVIFKYAEAYLSEHHLCIKSLSYIYMLSVEKRVAGLIMFLHSLCSG